MVRMDYPNLLIAIRESGRRQYEIARESRIREGRLSEILRRGSVTDNERRRLSRTLGCPETVLFAKTSGRYTAKRRAE
jgi:hypothetical protein